MKIRKATYDDESFILKANDEVNMVSGITNKSMLETNLNKDLFCKSPKFKCLIAEDDGKKVAYCAYSYIYWVNKGRGIYLSNIYVVPQCRRKGIVNFLMKYIQTHEKNVKFITGLVGNENEIMQRVFAKLGAEDVNMLTYYLKF